MNLKNGITINDTYEFVTCRVCGKQSKRVYGGHLKSHGLTSEEYLSMYPNAPLMSKKDTEKQGKHMKEEKYKKMFSEKFSGENNPNHVSKTTEEERKRRSPFSKDFIKYEIFNDEEKKEKSKEFFKQARKNVVLTTDINYYLNKGYNQEISQIMLSERQRTFSKEICINKYGEEKGIEIFNKRQNLWQKNLNENGNLKAGYSLISQELVNKIIPYYPLNKKYMENNIQYATFDGNNLGEFRINRTNGGIWIFDFVDKFKKKIIEFNGDQYHANPEIYKEKDLSHPFLKKKGITSKDIWEKDANKITDAEKLGFKVLTIWESEYRKNKEKTLEKCLEFLGIKKGI